MANIYLETVASRAFKLLRFVKRTTKAFKNVNSIISLYKTLTSLILL